jgi:hypothetical protein
MGLQHSRLNNNDAIWLVWFIATQLDLTNTIRPVCTCVKASDHKVVGFYEKIGSMGFCVVVGQVFRGKRE